MKHHFVQLFGPELIFYSRTQQTHYNLKGSEKNREVKSLALYESCNVEDQKGQKAVVLFIINAYG